MLNAVVTIYSDTSEVMSFLFNAMRSGLAALSDRDDVTISDEDGCLVFRAGDVIICIKPTYDIAANAPKMYLSASDILMDAADTIKQRGVERSMKSAIEAFNALTRLQLTEAQGWQLMTVLKLARANGGKFKLDDYLDGAAYLALCAESIIQTNEFGLPVSQTGA